MESMPEGGMAPPPSWWSRNWKWAVPTGCLALFSCGCLAFVVAGLGAAGAGLAAMTSAGPTDEAIQTAVADPEVQRALGQPIKTTSLSRQVSIRSANGRTQASLRIPLDGTQADGALVVEADKDSDDTQWTYTRLVVEVPGQRPIDLLDSSGGSEPPAQREALPSPDAPPPPPPPPGPPPGGSDIDL
jgi:hypothetical protein